MREILFRGKSVNTGAWLQGDYEHFFIDDKKIVCITVWGKFQCFVNPETVGQYTGLKDKNGVKIFEGDILEITDRWNKSQLWLVKYQSAALMLRQKGLVYYAHFSEFPQKFYSYEVIGNIHDNPELLEV